MQKTFAIHTKLGIIAAIISGENEVKLTTNPDEKIENVAIVSREILYKVSGWFIWNETTGRFDGKHLGVSGNKRVNKEDSLYDKKQCFTILERALDRQKDVSNASAETIFDALYDGVNNYFAKNKEAIFAAFTEIKNKNLVNKWEGAKANVEKLKGELEAARQESDALYLECKNKGLIE